LIAQRGWKATQERDLLIAYIYLAEQAQSALSNYQYDRTIALSKRALAQKPELPEVLKALYIAQMYTGRFVDASDTAKKWLANNKEIADSERFFATALGARNDHKQAAVEFTSWMASSPQSGGNLMVKVDSAGLALLDGNGAELERITSDFTSLSKDPDKRSSTMSPSAIEQVLERAGHWYYVAGNYDRAFTCFSDAQAMSLGSGEISAWLAFSGLQLGRMYVAQDEFTSAVNSFPDAHAGRIVLLWESGEKDQAVSAMAFIAADPKWKNKDWVTATYGAAIFQGLEDVRAEQKRREEEAKRKFSYRH
jgi:tetratricopeptide (TPR) repeat protein